MLHSTTIQSILLWLGILLSGTALAAKLPTPHVRVWMFSLFKSDVSRNIETPFYQQVATEANYNIYIDSNNQAGEYLKHCDTGDPGIVTAPFPVAKQFMKSCPYEVVGVTHQILKLYVRKDNPNPTPEAIQKLATLRGIHASIIAPEELSQLNDHFDLVVYTDLYNLLKDYKQDKVDALAIYEGAMRAVQPLREDWKPIMTFRQKGEGFALVSSKLPTPLKEIFTRVLLEKGGISTRVFVEKMGLGGFVPPTPQEVEQLKH